MCARRDGKGGFGIAAGGGNELLFYFWRRALIYGPRNIQRTFDTIINGQNYVVNGVTNIWCGTHGQEEKITEKILPQSVITALPRNRR